MLAVVKQRAQVRLYQTRLSRRTLRCDGVVAAEWHSLLPFGLRKLHRHAAEHRITLSFAGNLQSVDTAFLASA